MQGLGDTLLYGPVQPLQSRQRSLGPSPYQPAGAIIEFTILAVLVLACLKITAPFIGPLIWGIIMVLLPAASALPASLQRGGVIRGEEQQGKGTALGLTS